MIVFELIDGSVEVTVDGDGLKRLIATLERIENGGHEYLASPAWAGTELDETPQFPSSQVIHQVTFTRRPDENA